MMGLHFLLSLGYQIWAAGEEVPTDPRNMVMQGHKSWAPVKDLRVVLLSPEQEVKF